MSPRSSSPRFKGVRVVLRHTGGTVAEMWRPDFQEEARLVYGTRDEAHPGMFQDDYKRARCVGQSYR